MIKNYEARDPNSCWNKAKDNEFVFVLLERDPAAPAASRAWIEQHITLGKNQPNDTQITGAWNAIKIMESR